MSARSRARRVLFPVVLSAGAMWLVAFAATIALHPRHVAVQCGFHYARRTPWWLWGVVLGVSTAVWALVVWLRRAEPFRTGATSLVSWGTALGLSATWLWFLFSAAFLPMSGSSCVYGRPLRVSGGTHLPRVRRRRQRRPRDRDRRTIGHHWLECARGEFASVPAFDRLATQLAAVGAPGALVDAAHRCAREEAVHAERTMALAERMFGTSVRLSLPALPAPELPTASRLAVEALLDGCLNEACAAREAELRGRCADLDPEVADVLAMIARDERVHAELGWSIVQWALSVDPTRVGATLGRVEMGPPRAGFRFPARSDHGELRRFGWIDPDLCRAAHADVARDLRARLERALRAAAGTEVRSRGTLVHGSGRMRL